MTSPQPRPGILDIKPYVGGEGRVEGITDPLRMASNESVIGASPKARDAYINAAQDLHRYPDGQATALRLALGREYGIDAEKIVCGAGSEELIMQVVRAYSGPGDEVLYSEYGFMSYPIQIKAAGSKPVTAPEKNMKTDINAVIKAVTAKTKIVMIANPNNPTGSYLTKTEMKDLRDRLPEHILLVIDAAYAEFVEDPEYEDGKSLVDAGDNTCMLRTFSKVYGLAALRLGWGYFPKGVADALNRIRGAFNVSTPAQAAGLAALADKEFMQKNVEIAKAGCSLLSKGLEKMGFTVYPSVTNFLLVEFGPKAAEYHARLKEKGVFVRPMGAYNLPNHLRITVGTEPDNDYLLSIIASIKAELAA